MMNHLLRTLSRNSRRATTNQGLLTLGPRWARRPVFDPLDKNVVQTRPEHLKSQHPVTGADHGREQCGSTLSKRSVRTSKSPASASAKSRQRPCANSDTRREASASRRSSRTRTARHPRRVAKSTDHQDGCLRAAVFFFGPLWPVFCGARVAVSSIGRQRMLPRRNATAA